MVYHDYIPGSRVCGGGKRQTKEQAERDKRRQARQAADREKAEWIVAHMADEIDKMRKRDDNGQ